MNLVLTDAAAGKLKEIIDEEKNPALKLRISITGGGCSGFQYAFDLVENKQADDFVVEKNIDAACVSMLVDPMSLMYLTGARGVPCLQTRDTAAQWRPQSPEVRRALQTPWCARRYFTRLFAYPWNQG
ncbi:MAG: iron-sulfur cluster assembly accessory protein [Gammaproteobacteria bacterium]